MKCLWMMRFSVVLLLSVNTIAEQNTPLNDVDALLRQVSEKHQLEKKQAKQREQRFLKNKTVQKTLLDNAEKEFLSEQEKSNPLLKLTQSQQQELERLNAILEQQTQSLGDIHSIYREFSTDFAARLNDSMIQAQLKHRTEKLQLLQAQLDKGLPNIDHMQSMWLLIQEEMTEAGKNQIFRADVVQSNGVIKEQEVLRLGVFTLFSDNEFLRYVSKNNELLVLTRQPPNHSLAQIDSSVKSPQLSIYDPSRGDLLATLGQAPSLYERLLQGREVGFAIIALGVMGLSFAFCRFLYLISVSLKTRQQLNNVDQAKTNNPLGRIFIHVQHVEKNNPAQEELLQMSLDEAILKEIPALEYGHSLIKLLAALAPLLGLLGTVVGMIATFQTISLFGSGDPKLMASGISQALVTTVLGLLAAIPLLLSHNILNSFSRSLLQVLDEQSAGILARSQELKKS